MPKPEQTVGKSSTKEQQKKEIRSTIQNAQLEVREQDGTKKLSGYVVVFNSPAQIGEFTEFVAPGSFTRTLKEDDQVMLRDHRSELLLGRRSAGTLSLRQDSKGVAFDLIVPNTALGQDTYENTRLGNLKGCSFGFLVRDDTWKQNTDGTLIRIINDVQCFETTLTAFPAYEQTSVDVRSVRAKLTRSDDDDDDSICDPDSPDYDPDNDECPDQEDRCDCRCEQCSAGTCEQCSAADCESDLCAACPMQQRAAHMNLLLRRLRS